MLRIYDAKINIYKQRAISSINNVLIFFPSFSCFFPRNIIMSSEENRIGDIVVPNDSQEVRFFQCQFCDKEFPSMQALGGHQNKHRSERSEIRRARKEAKKTFLDQRYNHLYAFPMYNDFLYDELRGSSFSTCRIRSWSYPPPHDSYNFPLNCAYCGSRQARPNGNGAVDNNWNVNNGADDVGNDNRIANIGRNQNVGVDIGGDEDVINGLDLSLHL